MSWQWEFTKKSEKQFLKIDKQIRKRIVEKLDFWISSGNPLKFCDNLNNFELGEYRFRVGDYRIVFDIDDEMVVILAVGHRREIYK